RDTLVIAIPTDIESMDPHLSGGLSMRVWANVYETLLSRGPKDQLEPRLAESWKQVDPTHYQFKIRKGVKFTGGSVVNAATVAGILLEKNDPKSPHTHVSFTKWIKSARADDEYTLTIETNGPFPAALFYLANPMPGALYDMKARKEWGNLKTRSSGTGPYVLDKIEPGQYVQLKRNPDYWGPKPKTEYLRFRVIPEEATRVLALKRGEVDMVLDLGPDALTQVRDDPNIETKVYRIYRVNTLEYNFLQPLVKDNPAVREAIRLAIDRRSIAKNLIGVKGDPADSVVLDVSWGYTAVPECLEYDPQRARQVLDSAGWKLGPDGIRAKDGQKLNLVFVTDFTRDYRNREVAQAIQGYVREVGIGAELKLLERGPFIDTVVQKGAGYHLNIQGWGSPTNEASWWIYTRFHSENQALGAWGTPRTRMPDLDEAIDRARKETNEAKSVPLWHELQRRICKESLMVPLYFANGIQAVRKNVQGFVSHSDEWYGYRYVNATVD
ncbi:MAG TPA: ABC transporter substrate-binding protein, partial [Actinomycetota bacterium]|nr:ABC transporter substrate-binding protein [Actinomycetota bacterium]